MFNIYIKNTFILIIIFCVRMVYAQDDLSEILKNIQKVDDQVIINIKDNIEKQEKIDINNIYNKFNSQQNIYKKDAELLIQNTIYNNNWLENKNKLLKDFVNNNNINSQSPINKNNRIYLFISSSIPKNNIRKYVADIEKYPNAQIILNGFIGGVEELKPTIKYIYSILKKDKNCKKTKCDTYKVQINIDPILFTRYKIKVVPSLIYVNSINASNFCSEGNSDIVKVDGVHKFTGLVPISYMIKRLAEESDLDELKELSEYE